MLCARFFDTLLGTALVVMAENTAAFSRTEIMQAQQKPPQYTSYDTSSVPPETNDDGRLERPLSREQAWLATFAHACRRTRDSTIPSTKNEKHTILTLLWLHKERCRAHWHEDREVLLAPGVEREYVKQWVECCVRGGERN